MDQSGSRPGHSPADHEERPLIIERPDLAHPLRRVSAFVFTLAAWLLLLAWWFPIWGLVVGEFRALTGVNRSQAAGALALHSLVELFPLAFALVAAALLANGLLGLIHKKLAPPKVKRSVGMAQLASGMALDVDQLAAWQSARILHVEHGEHGSVVDAKVVR
jgi:poly-beta-1,6-N-acetyl-D-glucosamine biosynthesis protein PgaD